MTEPASKPSTTASASSATIPAEPGAAALPGASRYMAAVRELLDAIAATQGPAIAAAAAAIADSLRRDGLLYIFGSGHSHMLAEEGHYRAGGLAAVVPILATPLMLHEGAVISTRYERTSGLGPTVLARYAVSERDVLLVFSNSGVNTVPVEIALAAKAQGMTVIAVVALDYAATVPVGPAGHKLADIADIVVDNRGVPGDALVAVRDTGLRTGPASTVAGAFLLNAILTEVAWQLAGDPVPPPIYVSANMPGAVQQNAALIERYRTRNPHL